MVKSRNPCINRTQALIKQLLSPTVKAFFARTFLYCRTSTTTATQKGENKPNRAKMRPGCVSACIEHVTYMERQRDKQTDETTRVVKEALKTRKSII